MHGGYNRNRNVYEWEDITFSDIDVIKGLIKNRIELDKCYAMKLYETDHPFISNGTPTFHEIITCTYLDLEKLIDESDLTEKQHAIIERLMQGYCEDEIAEYFNDNASNIADILHTACQKMKNQNDFNWQEWTEVTGKTKIPDDVNYKKCTKCNKWLRANEENFSPNPSSNDGYYSICRCCKQEIDRNRKK